MKFLATTLLFLLTAITAFPQTTRPKPKPASAKPTTASKPKPATTAAKKPDEKTEWEKASTNPDGPARVIALRKFIKNFPKSPKTADAWALIVTTEVGLGNDKLAAGDAPGATILFLAAANDAPKPIPDALFTETLSKISANLFFRGARDEGIAIAKILEAKAETSADQLLSLATFYMSIENGSEAKRIAEASIKLAPDSSAAYQTLGLASRMDFQLEDSAAAYAKALELDPESLSARRGLAEMKRSLGRSEEAEALYREILAKDEGNVPAQTGLILSLFDAGNRKDAEAELAKSLDANPGNVILLTGAAYWYAAHEDGDKAIALSQKAIAADPRFIWSHIALARGLMSKQDPIAAEKVLLAARRYGNFPTLEYEIASARVAAGYYREAGDELAKSFSIRDGVIHANLGGRLPRESKNFTELVGYERRASIFAPTAADNPDNAAKLMALLEFRQELASAEPKAEIAAAAADEFNKGDDKMKVHRQIFTATQLLDKKVALSKVVEISRAATSFVDAGLDVPNPSVAVMANELYENRSIAAARGEYINVPAVPRTTLSAILRGQIEELNGWANYQLDATNEAVIRLKRAISVLPVDSAWWKTSTWQLGTALMRAGKDAEALDIYVKSYKSSGPSLINYGVIENLYAKVNGSTEGLEAKIGAKPAQFASTETVAQKTEPQSEPKIEPTPTTSAEIKAEPTPTPAATTNEAEKPVIKAEPVPTAESTPGPAPIVKATEEPKVAEIPSSVPASTPEAAKTETKTEPSPTPAIRTIDNPINIPSGVPVATPEPVKPEPKSEATPSPTPETVAGEASPKPTPEPTPEDVKATPTPVATASTTPDEVKAAPTPEMSVSPSPSPEASPSSTPGEVKATPTPEVSPSPTPSQEATPAVKKTPDEKPSDPAKEKAGTDAKELFPPVIITIPPPETPKSAIKEPEVNTSPTPAAADAKPTETPVATASPEPTPSGTSEMKRAESPATSPTTTPSPEPTPSATPEVKPAETVAANDGRPRVVDNKPEIAPCTLTVSEESITLQTGGGDLAVIVGLDNDGELDGLTALSSNPQDVTVRREIIAGVKARALFVVRAVSSKVGMYQIRFEMPCGKKDILVKVR